MIHRIFITFENWQKLTISNNNEQISIFQYFSLEKIVQILAGRKN